MRVPMEVRGQLAARFEVLLPYLNERQQRLALAVEARLLGHGGVRAVAQVAGVSEATVRKGVFELEAGEGPFPPGRVRRPGGGRKSAARQDPDLVPALLALVEPDERGDPMSPLRWTTKSLRHLAEELTRQGHPVSAPTVGRLLKRAGFSLQANVKTLEGAQHPDRDAQFRYLNEQAKDHQADGEPVISVDTKKREQLGRLPMAGREWRPTGEPVEVEDNHFFFTGPEVEQAIPYGIYDMTRNTGWVNVGVDHDSSVFAVESIRRWWNTRGSLDYPRARRLLITADAGGSNGYRYRVWKSELAALAAETGLQVTVCHFPPGTSKWNKIEHRLFSHITMNWRGRPLVSHQVVVELIAATRTATGLEVEARLDTGSYPTKVKVTKQQMERVRLHRHDFHGEWNYSIHPRPAPPAPAAGAAEPDGPAAGVPDRVMLSHPALTGMSRQQLDGLIAELAEPQQAQREQARRQRRGTKRRRAAGAGPRPKLTNADPILATVLYLRRLCTQAVLGELFTVDRSRVTEAIREIRPLLEEHGHAITPATARFPAPADLIAFLAAEDAESATQTKPAC